MITAIREKVVVKEGGRIEILSPDFQIGKEVEVIVLTEDEQDTTEYLLASKANRDYLMNALEEMNHPDKFIHVDLENL
jgi:antitoxin YefM